MIEAQGDAQCLPVEGLTGVALGEGTQLHTPFTRRLVVLFDPWPWPVVRYPADFTQQRLASTGWLGSPCPATYGEGRVINAC